MSQDADCLICGRPAEPSGEPACTCLTHSLSRPVPLSATGPDPADVALFSADSPPRTQRQLLRVPLQATPESRTGQHRKPKQRTRAAAAAGGAMAAAVVGCTALAASLMGGQGRTNEVLDKSLDGPTISLPDGDPLPDGGSVLPDGGERPEYGPPPAPSPAVRNDGTGGEAAGGAESEQEREPEPDAVSVTQPPPPAEPSTPPPAEPPPPPAEEDPGDPEDPGETTPTEPLPSPDPPGGVLREGDSGPAVTELQQRLLQLGWVYDGTAHGTFDERTRDAVARFQVAYGVQGDEWGVYGVNTRLALEHHTRL
ncbi:peptidoglycan-binding protein [Streptomyces sp. NPDC059853]|uniref:peptidoglycan-binding domain-containing protein n=1 Tax=Streptomyces sp. NPDC059853 TaxID=3346973 RepID=UPI00365396FE